MTDNELAERRKKFIAGVHVGPKPPTPKRGILSPRAKAAPATPRTTVDEALAYARSVNAAAQARQAAPTAPAPTAPPGVTGTLPDGVRFGLSSAERRVNKALERAEKADASGDRAALSKALTEIEAADREHARAVADVRKALESERTP